MTITLEDRTFHLNDSERWDWDHARTDHDRKVIEAAARDRVRLEQETSISQAAAAAKLEAEVAAAREAAAEPPPSLPECAAILARNPHAIGVLRERVNQLHREIVAIGGAPCARLDRYVGSCFDTLRFCSTPAHAVYRLEQAIRWLYDQSANRLNWDAQKFQDQQNALILSAPPVPSFDAVGFISRLAGRGIRLSLNPDGHLVAELPSLLTPEDRKLINAHRDGITNALRVEEV